MRPLPQRCRFPVLGVALAIAAAAPAWAAEEIAQPESPTPEAAVDLVPGAPGLTGIRLYGEEMISILADFGAADASEFSSTLGLRAGGLIGESFVVRGRAVGQAAFYDYHGDKSELEADLGLDDLFERLYDAEFALGGAYRLPFYPSLFGFTPHWSIFVEGSADLAWEDGASLSEAVKGSGTLGVGFELEPHLELALGVDVGSKIDGSGAKVNPVFGFRWRIREGMRLESRGLGLLFAVDLIPETLRLQLSGVYDTDRYRLDDDGGLPDRTLQQTAVPLLVALRWAPSPHWRLIGGVGSVVYQKWKVEPDDKPDVGPTSLSEDAGPAALLYFRLEHRF